MTTLDIIRKPVEAELRAFDEFVERQFTAEGELLSEMLQYALSSRGKGIRPLLVMLSAAMNAPMPGASLGRRPCLAAMLVEMIHVASLIHDDVIDESDTRRGKPSVNARWQSHKAVILGDYILARNMNLGLQSGQYDLVTHICGAMSALCEGEVLQGDCAEKHVMTRKSYLDIVHKKTASLIGVSASSGALAVGATRDKVARMRHFGESLGMAFQIQDDILDYTSTARTGKPRSPPTTTGARARLRCRFSACWSVWARSGRPRSSHGSSAVTRTPPPWSISSASSRTRTASLRPSASCAVTFRRPSNSSPNSGRPSTRRP